MRIVALEEHFNVPSLVRRIDPDAIARFGFPPGFGGPLADKLSDLGGLRLSEMDEASRYMCCPHPGPALICSRALKASHSPATSTTCWRKRFRRILIASRALRICR